jgi:hypothetical protein
MSFPLLSFLLPLFVALALHRMASSQCSPLLQPRSQFQGLAQLQLWQKAAHCNNYIRQVRLLQDLGSLLNARRNYRKTDTGLHKSDALSADPNYSLDRMPQLPLPA